MSFVPNSVEFERYCEFSKLGDRLMKIKSPTVSNGVTASSSEIWNANLAQSLTLGTLTNLWSHLWRLKPEILQSWLPCSHPKTQHSDGDIYDFKFVIYDFWMKSKLVGYTKTIYFQTGKNTVSWNFYLVLLILLIFKVVYWVPLTQLLPFD